MSSGCGPDRPISLFPLIFTIAFALFFPPFRLTFNTISPIAVSLFNMILPHSPAPCLLLCFCVYLFHPLADSLFINLMQFSHLYSTVLQQSPIVKKRWRFRSAKLSVILIPLNKNYAFFLSLSFSLLLSAERNLQKVNTAQLLCCFSVLCRPPSHWGSVLSTFLPFSFVLLVQ